MKKINTAVLLLVSLFLLVGCGQKQEEATLWGRVEGKEVDVQTKVPGRVVQMLVEEGQEVKKGQLLAVIDSKDLVAQKGQYIAQVESAQAQAIQASKAASLHDKTSANNLQAASAQVKMAATDLAMAEKNYQRYQSLYKSGAIAEKNLEDVKQKYLAAQDVLTQAQAALRSAQANQTDGHQVNEANVLAAQGKKAQAQAAVSQVENLLAETQIKAPMDGLVTSLIVEQGEMVSSGMPLMTILNPTVNWVNFKVKETDLSKYKLNSQVSLQGRDKDLQVTGTVVDISRKPEFATYRATDERGDTDVITFNVKVQVNSPLLRPGMRFTIEGLK